MIKYDGSGEDYNRSLCVSNSCSSNSFRHTYPTVSFESAQPLALLSNGLSVGSDRFRCPWRGGSRLPAAPVRLQPAVISPWGPVLTRHWYVVGHRRNTGTMVVTIPHEERQLPRPPAFGDVKPGVNPAPALFREPSSASQATAVGRH